MKFQWNEKQLEAVKLVNSPARHIMLFGGSRSGKTFLLIAMLVRRALRAPGSRHVALRFRFGHIKASIVHDTFPKVMRLVYPGQPYDINRADWFAYLPNGSQIWFGGLDDKARTEKILGNEYVSIFLNECSQIPLSSRNMAMTRLAQLVTDTDTKREMPLKMYYDENPPSKGHWTYSLFKLGRDPESKQLLEAGEYGSMQINPKDNERNLPADYFRTLESLPARLRKRFFEGEFADIAPGALFTDEMLDRWRFMDGELPDMLRVVVGVDPSGAEDSEPSENDEIGIVVCGLGTDGNGYVLEDLTCKASPAVWGKIATDAFERNSADRIVGEVNYGGAMVAHVIQTARPRTPFRKVTATRGKVVRAEPISAFCDIGKVRMAGIFRELEDELCAFTDRGYVGERSPNRADAMIWAMSDLFPDLLIKREDLHEPSPVMVHRPQSEMHRLFGVK